MHIPHIRIWVLITRWKKKPGWGRGRCSEDESSSSCVDALPRNQIVGTHVGLQITGVGSKALLSLYPLHGGRRDGRTWEAMGVVEDGGGVYVSPSRIGTSPYIEARGCNNLPRTWFELPWSPWTASWELLSWANSLTTRERAAPSLQRDVTV